MSRLERGDLPPEIVAPPPGPRSRALGAALARAEAPGINTLGAGDEPSIVWAEALGANVLDVDDIEGVHAMRVASRRLRAAIEVFRPCFPAKQRKAVLNEVKALADALGERRDRDVAVAMLTSFAAAMPHPDRRGIGSLIDEFRAEQLAANEELVGVVEASRLDRLQAGVNELAAAAREAAGAGRAAEQT